MRDFNQICLFRKRLPIVSLTMLMLVAFAARGQTTYRFTGQVVDENSDPATGATVQLKGSPLGTVADVSGNYAFEATLEPGNYTLIFRSVGLATQEVPVTLGSETNVVTDVTLAMDILGLEEVVVTGTGALTEKKQLGNTISTVNGQAIAGAGTVDVTAALSGKLAGIQVMQNSGDPAGGISVRLRSASTVNGSSDPLYIIDGVIVNNNSTDVLASGSVVQNRLSDINPQDIDRIEIIKGAAAAAIYGSRASNGVVQIFTKKGQSGKPVVTFSTSINFNSLRKKREFNEVPLTWTAASGTSTKDTTRYDYQDMVFRNSVGTDNYISISGGKDKTNYFTSVSYLKNNGIMKGSDYERIGGRLRINQVLNDWATVSLGTYISTNHSHDIPNGGYDVGVLPTILFSNNITNPQPDVDGNYPSMTFLPNILEYLNTFDFQQKNNRSITDIQVNLAPTKGLTINYVLGFDNSEANGTRYIPIGTNNQATGSARTSTVSTQLLNSDINTSYDVLLNDKLKSTTSAGFSWQGNKSTVTTITATGLAIGIKTTEGAATVDPSELRSERTFWGGFLQQTLGYDNKLFLTGAIRLDGASVFGADERNQFYPKVSASYAISEEDFWKTSVGTVVDYLKFRGAWGQAGNLTAIGPFDRLSNYDAVSITKSSGLISPNQLGNPNLRPERQTEVEFGVDMALFKNRIGIELTYYSQDIEDLLLARTLAPSTGAGSRIENIGTMTNKGFEVLLTAVPVQKPNLRWSVTGTFSANKNKVNNIAGEQFPIGNFNFSVAKNGYPLGVFYQGFYARNDDGSLLLTSAGIPQREKGTMNENGDPVPQRDTGTGQPTGSNLSKVIGDPNPDFIASLINEVQVKNFSFRVQFDAVQGFDVLSWDTRMFYRFGGGPQEGEELLGNAVRGTGVAKFGIAESYVEDGSFVKLREIAASYTLKNPVTGISSIKFTASGRNLFSFDNYSSYDPEVNMDAQSNGSRGGIMGLVPIPRVIRLGVTATF